MSPDRSLQIRARAKTPARRRSAVLLSIFALAALTQGAGAQFGPTPMPKIVPSDPGPWVAVAIDGRGGWGASIMRGGGSRVLVQSDARQRCGSGCRVTMIGKGTCVAFAQSRSGGYWYGQAHGSNRQFVSDVAMRGCSSGAPRGTCRLEHVNCL